MELENLLPTRLKSSMKMKALSSKLRFHTHIRQMGLQNAPSGPSWQSGVVCYITPSWTSVSGLKQRWRQSTWRINRLPSPKIPNMTSFEIVCGSKPSVKHMRVFWMSRIHSDFKGETSQLGSQSSNRHILWGMKKSPRHIECSISRPDK